MKPKIKFVAIDTITSADVNDAMNYICKAWLEKTPLEVKKEALKFKNHDGNRNISIHELLAVCQKKGIRVEMKFFFEDQEVDQQAKELNDQAFNSSVVPNNISAIEEERSQITNPELQESISGPIAVIGQGISSDKAEPLDTSNLPDFNV